MAYRKLKKTFFKFETPNDELEGIWLGTEEGKFGLNGRVRDMSNVIQTFTLNAALKDLEAINEGTQIKLVFTGLQKTDGGQEYKAFDIYVDDDSEGETQAPADDEPPF
jgi:hypothetical protein